MLSEINNDCFLKPLSELKGNIAIKDKAVARLK